MAAGTMSMDMNPESFWSYASILRDSGTLCDIQLTVRGGLDNREFVSLPAHKLVLAAGSVYFRGCLDRGDLLDIYNFDGISLSNLRTLLDYLYRRISWPEMQANAEAAVAARTLGITQHSAGHAEVGDGKKVLLVRQFDTSGKLVGERKGSQQKAGQKRPRTVLSSEEIAKIVVNRRYVKDAETKTKDTCEHDQSGKNVRCDTGYEEKMDVAIVDELGSQPFDHTQTQPLFYTDDHQEELLSDATRKHEGVPLTEFTEGSINITEPTDDFFPHSGTHMEETPQYESETVSNVGNYYDDQMERENLEHLKAEVGEIYVTQDGKIFDTKQDLLNSECKGADTSLDNKNTALAKPCVDSDASIADPAPVENNGDTRVQTIVQMASTPGQRSSEETHGSNALSRSVGRRRIRKPVNDEIYEWSQTLARKRPRLGDGSSSGKVDSSSSPKVVNKRCESDDDDAACNLPSSGNNDTNSQDGEIVDCKNNDKLTDPKYSTEEVEDVEPSKTQEMLSTNTTALHNNTDKSIAVKKSVKLENDSPLSVSLEQTDNIDDVELTEQVIDNVRKEVDLAVKTSDTGEAVTAVDNTNKKKKSSPCVCSFCGRIFKNITGQRNHENWIHRGMRTREGSSPQRCEVCNRVFRSYPALRNHETRRHGLVREWPCDVCGVTCHSKALLRRHQMREHEQQLFECDKCNATFKSREGWKIHMYKKHSDEDPSHMCDICGKVFKMLHELRLHCNLTHSDRRDFQCQLCARSFKNNVTLTRHLKTYHSNERNYECDVCKNRFKTQHDMKKHRERHFRQKDPLNRDGKRNKKHPDGLEYPCSFCGKVFKKYYLAVTHENMQHRQKSEGVQYMCTICNKSFAIKHYLMQHINNKHRPRRFKCQAACGREFAQPHELRKHQSQPCQPAEAAVKPYRCCYCGHGFTLKGNLTKHLQGTGRCLRWAQKQQVVDYVVMVDNQTEDGSVQMALTQDEEAAESVEDAEDGIEDVDLQTVQALQLLQCAVPDASNHAAAVQLSAADEASGHLLHIQPDVELAKATDNIILQVAVDEVQQEVEIKQEMAQAERMTP